MRRHGPRWSPIKIGVTVAGIAAAAAVTVAIVLALTVSTQPGPTIPLLNLPVPTFDLQALDPSQAAVSSALLRQDGPTVVNFWGSWCPPCVQEMPALQAVHHELGNKVRFVGIDEEDTRGAALHFLHHVGVTYPSGFDGDGAVAAAFNLEGTPTTYFVAHGKMLDFHTGRMTKQQLLTYLEQIFGVS